MIMNMKQKKINIEPRIRLNIYRFIISRFNSVLS